MRLMVAWRGVGAKCLGRRSGNAEIPCLGALSATASSLRLKTLALGRRTCSSLRGKFSCASAVEWQHRDCESSRLAAPVRRSDQEMRRLAQTLCCFVISSMIVVIGEAIAAH